MEDSLVGRIFGQYRIIEEIGAGRTADVYRAEQETLGRSVALKVLRSSIGFDRTFRRRFEVEAKTAARMLHPAIVPVYDFGEQHGRFYIVMPFLSGGTLAAHIEKAWLALDEAAIIIARIAGALDYAHAEGVIHRAVKPLNILFDQHGNAFLSDFGIAQMIDPPTDMIVEEPITGTGDTGTPEYMAPEMAKLGGLTPLVDVYALGVTLFEMLTGKQPYESHWPHEVVMKHREASIPDAHELRPDLPDGVQGVIEQGMAKDPAKRYQNAGELADDFAVAIGKTPVVSARQVGVIEAPIPVEEASLPEEVAVCELPHVFLSYCREDFDIMHRVRDDLWEAGMRVWTDEELQPGTPSWKIAIERAIEEAGGLVVILTPDAKGSAWVREELDYARVQSVQIFPVLARGDERKSVPFGFSGAQWVDLRSEAACESAMSELIRALRNHLGFARK